MLIINNISIKYHIFGTKYESAVILWRFCNINKSKMKYIRLTVSVFELLLLGCFQCNSKATSVTDNKEQIQNLIRTVFEWSDSKESINLLPVI